MLEAVAHPDRILAARLDGTARRLLSNHTPRPDAIAELHAITRRPDVLTAAAGSSLGAWQHNQSSSWQGRDVALLLVDAGADAEQVKVLAAETLQHLSRATRGGGIGESRA